MSKYFNIIRNYKTTLLWLLAMFVGGMFGGFALAKSTSDPVKVFSDKLQDVLQ